jgi:uncharacterized protein YndB with AHSA1/START domain
MIEKNIFLPRLPEEAFLLFTERISEWWPPSHRPSKDSRSRLRMLPSGRFWERAEDGREFDLGFIRDWDAPSRIVLDFYLGTDADHPTEVTIRFTREGEGTRVTVEHRPTAASRDLWEARAPRYQASWDAVLAAFIQMP